MSQSTIRELRIQAQSDYEAALTALSLAQRQVELRHLALEAACGKAAHALRHPVERAIAAYNTKHGTQLQANTIRVDRYSDAFEVTLRITRDDGSQPDDEFDEDDLQEYSHALKPLIDEAVSGHDETCTFRLLGVCVPSSYYIK
jgi:hypothetical protein